MVENHLNGKIMWKNLRQWRRDRMNHLTDDVRDMVRSMLTAPPKPKIRTRRIISREAPKRKRLLNQTWESDALGCSTDHIAETQEYLKAHGCPTEFTKEGCAIITGPKHHRAISKAMGHYTGRDGFEAIGPTGTRQEKLKREAFAAAKRAIANGTYE